MTKERTKTVAMATTGQKVAVRHKVTALWIETQRRMRSRQPMRQGMTGMWIVAQSSMGRRAGRG